MLKALPPLLAAIAVSLPAGSASTHDLSRRASTAAPQEPASEDPATDSGAPTVQPGVIVVGLPHFWQMGDEVPQSTIDAVLGLLEQFAPDRIAVEVLHPTVSPSAAPWEPFRGDPETLGTLWGLDHGQVTLELSQTPAPGSTSDRLRLGQLHYLAGDEANSAYQWWLAAEEGSTDPQLQQFLRLIDWGGNEVQELGFRLARSRGHASLLPFDYQGPDAQWGPVMDEIMSTARELALTHTGARPGTAAWDAEGERFKTLIADTPSTYAELLEAYGGEPQVAELLRVFDPSLQELPDWSSREHGLIGYLQSSAFIDGQREAYASFRAISARGLGEQLVGNYETRNARMAAFVDQDARANGYERVLVLVGAGHKLFLDDEFERLGFRVLDSSTLLR